MTRHLLITGLVQGVAYRESMCREAARLGISGWVRNRLDGSVEAVVDGDEAAIAAMLAWTRRGPPAAQVANVAVSECDEHCVGFIRRPTA
jgi:acylphosphatase